MQEQMLWLPANVLQAGAEASSHVHYGLAAGSVPAILCHAVSTAGGQQQGLLVGSTPASSPTLPLLFISFTSVEIQITTNTGYANEAAQLRYHIAELGVGWGGGE